MEFAKRIAPSLVRQECEAQYEVKDERLFWDINGYFRMNTQAKRIFESGSNFKEDNFDNQTYEG